MAKRKSTKGQTTIYKTYTYKTKDRVTRTPLKTGDELMCSGRVCVVLYSTLFVTCVSFCLVICDQNFYYRLTQPMIPFILPRQISLNRGF